MAPADTGWAAEVSDAPMHTPWGVLAQIYRIALTGKSQAMTAEPLPGAAGNAGTGGDATVRRLRHHPLH
ncbi:hypothetical protein ACFY7Y_33020 [Streptomyces virginiae]|uniref:hypothetical protein n=1 Tax=Streptomyces virginiae TaxID=1961 RepID=UPI000A448740|nr:hypothetical protein [Streptomyces virginiae]